MFENITNGWKLASAVRKLTFQDRGLLIYPVISGIVILLETIAIFATFFLSSFALGLDSNTLFVVFLFIYYVIVYFTSVFILVAMLLAFRSFENGKKISIGEALSQTMAQYSMLMLEWAIFEAIVTMIIRAIESRIRGIGGILLGLGVSMAMSIATVFAIPVIIDKKTGPISTVKESTGFIINNFGKTFGGLIYSDLYSLIFTISGIVLVIAAFFAIAVSVVLTAILFIAGIALLMYGMMLNYMLINVYKLVLYDYKNGGKLPKGLPADLVNNAVKTGNPASNNVL